MTDRALPVPSAPDAIVERVAANLLERCEVVRGCARLLVGVSGGADSVALLDLLHRLQRPLSLGLEVAHFDHALRPTSRDDATFVADLARTRQLPFHTARWDAPCDGEAAARDARLGYLDTLVTTHHFDAVVLAHHLDDRIETMLLHLARGTGLRGTYGMRWRSRWRSSIVLRPLLDLPRAALRTWLTNEELLWREDETNLSRGPARNRLRLDALPALDEALRPGWRERWSRTLDDLVVADDLVEKRARQLLRHAESPAHPQALDLATLRQAPDLVRRAALLLFFQRALLGNWDGTSRRPQIQRLHLEQAARLVQERRSGQRLDLAAGWVFHCDRELASLAGPESTRNGAALRDRFDLQVRDVACETADHVLRGDAGAGTSPTTAIPPQAGSAFICADDLVGPLELRTALPGDRVRLLGAPGTQRLVRILQGRAVPRRFRPDWPIVQDARGIVWVPGVGIAERGRIAPHSTRVLELRLQPRQGASAHLAQAPEIL